MFAGIGFVMSIGLLAIWTAFALRYIDRIISPTQSGWELYSSLGWVAILLLWVVTIRSLATKGSRSVRLRVATSVFNTAGLFGLLQASYVNNWNFFDRFAIVISHLSSEFALLTVCSAFLYLAFGSYRQPGFVFLGAFGTAVGAWIATQAGYVSSAGGMFWGYVCIAGFLLLAARTRVMSQFSSSMHPEDIVARGARKYAFSRAGFVVLKWALVELLGHLTYSLPAALLWPRMALFPVVAFASFPRTMWRAIIESHADPSRLRRLLNTALSPEMIDTWTTFSIVAVYYLVARTGVSGGQYERAFFVLLAGVTAARHVHLVLWSLPKQLRLRTIRPYAAFLVILVLEAVSVLLILAPIAADQPVSAIGIAELVSVRHVLFRPGEWLDVWRSGAVGTSALIVNGAFVAFQAGILGVLFRFREFAMTDEERVGRALRLLQFGVVDQAARILAGVRARTAESAMAEAALSLSKGAPEEAKHRVGLAFQIEDVPVTTNGTYLVLMGLCASLPLRCETCGIVFRDAINKNVPDAYLALPFGTVLLRGCS